MNSDTETWERRLPIGHFPLYKAVDDANDDLIAEIRHEVVLTKSKFKWSLTYV